MSRRQRLHIPHALYHVIQRGSEHQPVFTAPADYAMFERLLTGALRRTHTSVHAYCWMPQAIHMLVQIDEIPVGRFMQGLTSRYARSIHQRAGGTGHFFQQRYQAILIDSESYLRKLVRYIHYVPVLAGLAPTPRSYSNTSHSAYVGTIQAPWLTTRSVLNSGSDGEDAQLSYDELMSTAPSEQDIQLFEHGCGTDLRVIGSPDFLAGLPRHSRTYHSNVSLDQIINNVTCALEVDRTHVFSRSRQRQLALARALIAWFATERRVCTLSEVARRLRRDPSTLSVAISRYRDLRPDLFKLNSLHYLVSLGSQEMRAESHAE